MKKKVVAAIMSVALVAAVGIGGTLAYLSATSNQVDNSFTVGKGYIDDGEHEGVYIDETEYTYNSVTEKNEQTGDRTETGNEYKNLYPSSEYTKDPKVNMVGGSVESYVFVKVSGVDALEATYVDDPDVQIFDIADWNTNAWKKVVDGKGNKVTDANDKEGDGIYVYQGLEASNNIVDVSKAEEGSKQTLPEAVFGKIVVNNVKSIPDADEKIENVRVSACAVQAAQAPQGWKTALEEAKFAETALN